MKFLVCIAVLVAVAAAEPGLVGYSSYGHAAPWGHYAPVVRAVAPVATSWSNVHSVHQRPVVAATYGYGAYPGAYSYTRSHGAYPSVYGHSGLGYKSYGYRSYGLHY